MKTEILNSILSELQGIRKALEPKVTTEPVNNLKQNNDVCDTVTSPDTDQKPKWPESWGDLPQKYRMKIMYHEARTSFHAFEFLYALREAYRGEWKPELDSNIKDVIVITEGEPRIGQVLRTSRFLSFEANTGQAEHFLKHHRELIEQAKDLL